MLIHLRVGSEHVYKFVEVYGPQKENVYVFQGPCGTKQNISGTAFRSLDAELNEKEIGNPPMEWRKTMKFDGILWYIFTSGTTGMPKAAKVTHK